MHNRLLNSDYILRYQADQKVEFILPNQQLYVKKPLISGNQLNILVWNIFKQKRENSIRLLEQYVDDTSLILLQEAQTNARLINFVTQYKKIADQVPAYAFNNLYAGVMTISDTYPLCSLPFKAKEPLIRVPKSALITKYQLNDQQQILLVANIHAINFSFGVKIYNQQIKMLYSQMLNHQGPVILAGDFNSWSRQRLNLVYQLIRKLGLKPVNFATDMRKTFLGRPLDFVFYRGLKVADAEIIHTDSSDHNPLLVNFMVMPV